VRQSGYMPGPKPMVRTCARAYDSAASPEAAGSATYDPAKSRRTCRTLGRLSAAIDALWSDDFAFYRGETGGWCGKCEGV
jgi:hypothetical protein